MGELWEEFPVKYRQRLCDILHCDMGTLALIGTSKVIFAMLTIIDIQDAQKQEKMATYDAKMVMLAKIQYEQARNATGNVQSFPTPDVFGMFKS